MMNQLRELLLLALMFSFVKCDDCPYKVCLCTGSDIICSNQNLQTVPPLVTKNNLYSPVLHLENNQISHITAGSFPANLTEISLLSNPLTSIDDAAFDDTASTLTRLSMSNVFFVQLPNALGHIKSLVSLTINDAQIQDWNEAVMKLLGPTINTLILENSALYSWPPWIRYFTQLTELRVVSNQIPSLPDDALDSVNSTLTSLSLMDNTLTSVPKALTKLKSLQMLYLQSNQIVDIQWLPQLNKLFSLDLNTNQINDTKSLTAALKTFSSTLSDLDLHGNRLPLFPDLSSLTGITNLDLSTNAIFDPSLGSSPPAITSLVLDNNNLPAFPYFASQLLHVTSFTMNTNAIKELHGADFPPATEATELAYNLITALTDTSFPVNSRIKSLNVNDNPIVTVSSRAFANLPQLTILYLRKTKLTRIPMAISPLTNLNYFDMSGTRRLICSCQEKSLASLILKLEPKNVPGNCGYSSIYTFYSFFSPNCP